MNLPSKLTYERVHEIRTSGLSDAEMARKYDCGPVTVYNARVGIKWKSHPTPPDTAPRKGRPALTFDAVHYIRTCGLPDQDLATLYGVSATSITMARRGRTWIDHPTPPDRFPRSFGAIPWISKETLERAPNIDLGFEPANRDLFDRLRMRCVLDADGCWLWTGSDQSSGDRPSGHHGQTSVDGTAMGTHRAMWVAVHGPIPAEMSVCHECDKPKCIKPTCLWLGTHLDNMRDSIVKGRHVNVRDRA